jgi:hypothetical protein
MLYSVALSTSTWTDLKVNSNVHYPNSLEARVRVEQFSSSASAILRYAVL